MRKERLATHREATSGYNDINELQTEVSNRRPGIDPLLPMVILINRMKKDMMLAHDQLKEPNLLCIAATGLAFPTLSLLPGPGATTLIIFFKSSLRLSALLSRQLSISPPKRPMLPFLTGLSGSVSPALLSSSGLGGVCTWVMIGSGW